MIKNKIIKFVYVLLKYPLILIFLKTPFIKIFEKRFSNMRNLQGRSVIMYYLDRFFEKEYLSKNKNSSEIRKLISSTVELGKGELWAKHYYAQPAENLDLLKKKNVGLISANDAKPIFEKMINHIKENKLDENNDTYIIQVGSSSGRDLEFFYNYFPKLNYISTDINNEILNFQKNTYQNQKFNYFECFAEDIDKCIDNFKIKNKNIIIFSIGSLQYVVPFFLNRFFFKIKKINKMNLFINEPIDLNFKKIGQDWSKYYGKSSFSHRYEKYADGLKIIEEKVIRPYDKNDKIHKRTGTFYLHAKND